MGEQRMTKRVRARLQGEEGFTILETIIAMVVIFGSLTALMYTATSGFRYIGLARDRQAATGAATRIMEQIQALTSDAITRGMKTSDLTGDPRIKTPTACGDGAYHFESCSGEKIVHDSAAPAAVPLVPHTGTLAAPEYPTDYTWATYITNSDPEHDPYRITVVVSWRGGEVAGAAKFIQLQGLWASPKGTTGSALLHPFAGPTQPYFTGSAAVPQGTVAITGSIQGSPISSAPMLLGPQAETRASAEQVSQVQISLGQSGAKTSSVSRGQATLTIAADGNPSTATSPYAPSGVPPAALLPSYGSAIPVTSAPVALSLSAGSSGDSGSAVAADAANATTAKCPSPSSTWPSSQSDSLPCGWGQVVRGGTMNAAVDITKILGTTSATAGLMTLVQMSGTSAIDTWGDRIVTAGTTGSITMTSKRTVGTLEVLGVPAKFFATNTSNDTNTAATITTLAALQSCTSSNYAIRATGGTATAAASSGVSAANPSGGWVGSNVKLYNGTACVPIGDALLNGSGGSTQPFTGFTLQRYVRPGGSNHNCITYRVSLPSGGTNPVFGGVTTAKSPTAGTTLTTASSTVNPLIRGDFRVELIYETNQNSSCTSSSAIMETLVDVTLSVSLGGLTARGQYVPPPTGG